MDYPNAKGRKNNQKTRIVLFCLLSVLGVACSFLLLVFSIPGFLGSFSISSNTEYFFSGEYAEYLYGDRAYSCFPIPEDLGGYNNIVFRFWKHPKDDYKRDNTFFLEIDYEEAEFKKVLPIILTKYDLLNKDKYYFYYVNAGKKDRYNKDFKENRYSFIFQNEYLSFEDYLINYGDYYTISINLVNHKIRFIYNTGSQVLVIRLNRNDDVWGKPYDSETMNRLQEQFWENNPPV